MALLGILQQFRYILILIELNDHRIGAWKTLSNNFKAFLGLR